MVHVQVYDRRRRRPANRHVVRRDMRVRAVATRCEAARATVRAMGLEEQACVTCTVVVKSPRCYLNAQVRSRVHDVAEFRALAISGPEGQPAAAAALYHGHAASTAWWRGHTILSGLACRRHVSCGCQPRSRGRWVRTITVVVHHAVAHRDTAATPSPNVRPATGDGTLHGGGARRDMGRRTAGTQRTGSRYARTSRARRMRTALAEERRDLGEHGSGVGREALVAQIEHGAAETAARATAAPRVGRPRS